MKYDDQTTTAKDQVFMVGFTGLPEEISDSLIGKKAGDIVEVEAQFLRISTQRPLQGKRF